MTVFIFVRIIYLKQKKEETIYDYGPSPNFQGFDFLTSHVCLLCIIFFFFFSDQKVWNFKCFDFLTSYVYLLFILFFSSQNKRRRRRRRTGKKVRLRIYKLCIIFSYKKNRDIFISFCGQESSIIEQCLATKCKVRRKPLVYS